MLVIGFKGDYTHSVRELDVDPSTDAPRKIHDALKKATKGQDYCLIVCIEDDKEVDSFADGEDYDLSEKPEDDVSNDTNKDDDDDADDDDLFDDKDDFSSDEDE